MCKIVNFFIIFFFIFMTAGCATSYGPSGMGGGYKERKIDDDTYIVSFFGNGHAKEQRVWNFWIYRCAELTLSNGYNYFELLPSDEHALWKTPNKLGPVTFTMLTDRDELNNEGVLIKPVQYYSYKITTYSSKGVVNMYNKPLPHNVLLLLDANTIVNELKPYMLSPGNTAPPNRKDLLVRAAVETSIRANQFKNNKDMKLDSNI